MEKYFKIIEDKLIISSNYNTINLAYSLALIEKGDLSYLGGIPGTIGGAIYNNSGAYNKSIKDDIISVKYINTAGNIISLDKKDLALSHRYSIFHDIKGIIIEATFKIDSCSTKDLLLERKMKRQEA